MCGPQIRLRLFTFRLIAFDYNPYSLLTRWCKGNASALGARGLGFNSRLRQGFLCLFFVLLLLCFTFLSKKHTHYLQQNVAISFAMLIYFLSYWKQLLLCFTFKKKNNTLFATKCCNFFCNVNLFSILLKAADDKILLDIKIFNK